MVNAMSRHQPGNDSAVQVSAALGASLSIGMIFVLHLAVLDSALILGLFLKKSSIMEHGPTGPLAQVTMVE